MDLGVGLRASGLSSWGVKGCSLGERESTKHAMAGYQKPSIGIIETSKPQPQQQQSLFPYGSRRAAIRNTKAAAELAWWLLPQETANKDCGLGLHEHRK